MVKSIHTYKQISIHSDINYIYLYFLHLNYYYIIILNFKFYYIFFNIRFAIYQKISLTNFIKIMEFNAILKFKIYFVLVLEFCLEIKFTLF